MERKGYNISYIDVDDVESICGALFNITHILDELSEYLDAKNAGLGTGVFQISTLLDGEIKRIEEETENV